MVITTLIENGSMLRSYTYVIRDIAEDLISNLLGTKKKKV